MEAQNQNRRPSAAPGEPSDRVVRTFARRIECAPAPRGQPAAAAQHGRGPGHALAGAAV